MTQQIATNANTYHPLSDDRRRKGRKSVSLAPVARFTLEHWKLLATGAVLVATSLGFRMLGPGDDLRQIARDVRSRDSASVQRDSALSLRITSLEGGAGLMRTDIGEIRKDISTLLLLQCQAMQRSERGASSTCLSILLQPRRP